MTALCVMAMTLEHQETLLYWEGDGAPVQVSARGCEFSILGDIEKMSGHGPGQHALRVTG